MQNFQLILYEKLPIFEYRSTIRIEILNPNALKLIEGMQDLKLIKVSDEPESKLKGYLKKMRKNAIAAPDIDEITAIVEEVRTELKD